MNETERNAFLEILALTSGAKSSCPSAANPSADERLEMIARIAKRHAARPATDDGAIKNFRVSGRIFT